MVWGAERSDNGLPFWHIKKLSGGGSPATAESILLAALAMGLTVADLDSLTLGMLNDLAIAWTDEEQEEEATQADYDAF